MKSGDYLVWIDLEMTGLDPQHDAILEIATIVTDGSLQIIAEGPSCAIHHPDIVLRTMDSWCREHHGASGLTERVRSSTITLAEAEQQTVAFLHEWCLPKTAPLCGNSVYHDRAFLRRWMVELEQFLHYRIIDVSTVKELVRRWYPETLAKRYEKEENHRALLDIRESIIELQYYRASFFKQ